MSENDRECELSHRDGDLIRGVQVDSDWFASNWIELGCSVLDPVVNRR